MKYAEACAIFKVKPETATWLVVKGVFRHMAHLAHPDFNGGSRERWDKLREAYDVLKTQLCQPRPCPECDHGQVKKMQRGRVVTHDCPKCDGKGILEPT